MIILKLTLIFNIYSRAVLENIMLIIFNFYFRFILLNLMLNSFFNIFCLYYTKKAATSIKNTEGCNFTLT